MPHPFDLAGRLALVTGGGSGLGLAIAEGLAAAGARVVINGRNRAKLDAALEQLAEAGHVASVAAFDVSDEAAVAAGVADIEGSLGPVDILVNNAGMNLRKPLDTYTLEEWRQVQGVNADAPFLMTRARAWSDLRRGRAGARRVGRRRAGAAAAAWAEAGIRTVAGRPRVAPRGATARSREMSA